MAYHSPGGPASGQPLVAADGVSGPAEAAGDKSSRARGGVDPLPERSVPSAVAANLGVPPSGGQG